MRTQPSAAPDELTEFTLRAVVTGTILGIIFGASNAYLGLRVGLTVSASIPAAVMTVAVFTARLIFHGFTFGEAAYAGQPVLSIWHIEWTVE